MMSAKEPHTVTGGDVRRRMEELAPPALAESWDNVGWQVGHDAVVVHGILVTLDVELGVLDEAARLGANMVISHHPMLFRGLKSINPADYQGQLLRRLLCDGIHLYSAHTNLDAVPGGVNSALAAALGLMPVAPLVPVRGAPEEWGFGAICEGEPLSTREVVGRVREALGSPFPRVTPALGGVATHGRIALLGGSGGSMIQNALSAGCTLYVTGEVKYHDAQDAARAGLTLIEAGHYYSERSVLAQLVRWLEPLGVPVFESQQVTSPFGVDWEEE